MESETESGIFSIGISSVDSNITNEDLNSEEPQELRNRNINANLAWTINSDKHILIYKHNKKNCRLHRNLTTRENQRIVQKSGYVSDIFYSNIPSRHIRFMRDISNTIIDSRWRWITLLLVFLYAFLWFFFAWLWMIIANDHGDLEHPLHSSNCVVGSKSFTSFLILSVETQTTIGGGNRYPTENCPEGLVLLCLQVIIASAVEGAIIGMFYVKMLRPYKWNTNKSFSSDIVICQRDDELCLMFRVSDRLRAHIINTKIEAYLVETTRYKTPQGEQLEINQTPLKLEAHGLLLWPLTIVHKITTTSPFYNISAKDLFLKNFEVIVLMTGCSEGVGQITQSKTSYLPSNIKWGHRFLPCVSYDTENNSYIIHNDKLSATEEIDTPLCSAQRLSEVFDIIHEESDIINSEISSSMSFTSPMSSATVSPLISHKKEFPLDVVLETDM